MAALNSKALQEQLSAIMAALTKAAVAEICELVEEGYSLLRMEVSRSRRENQDLKKKLHLIESIVVRGGSGAAGTLVPAAEPRGAPQQQQQQQQQPDTEHGAPAAELPEVVLIKDEDSETEETFDEDSGGGEAAAASEDLTLLPVGPPAGRRRSGGHADRKSFPDQPALKVCRATAATQKKSLSGSVLDPPGGETGLSSQQEEAQAAEAVCSYCPGAPDLLLVQQEAQQVPSGPPEQASYFSEGCLMESDPNRPELDFSLMWDKQPRSQLALAHFLPPHSPDPEAFAFKLAASLSTDSQLSESGSSGFEYESVDGASFHPHRDPAGGRGRRFLCSICNRTYATSQNLEVHMRIHTGERPFSCEQCGKKFTQSAHLKSHTSVHSGERPYPCRVCSRSFIVRYSLKLHMKKCHPDVPNE